MSNTQETVASFRKALAEALIAAAKAETMRHTRANSVGRSLGLGSITVTEDNGTSGYKVPEFTEETTINGQPRADFTPAAQAKHDKRRLHDVKREAYAALQSAVSWDDLPEDVAVNVCKATGLPVPETKTDIRYTVVGFGTGRITVNGEVDRDEIVAKLATLAKDEQEDTIRVLFGQPQASASDRVAVSITPRRTWPNYPAYQA